MAARAKKKRESRGGRALGLGVALAAAVLSAAVVAGAVALLSGGDSGDEGAPSSRFEAIHRFETPDYHSLAFDPSRNGVVFFGHHGGLQMSEDGGESWSTVIDEPNWDAMNTVFDPFAPETVYVAGHDVFFRSTDGGATWQALRPNLPSLDLHTFAASPNNEGRLYAIPAGHGLYVSEDRGGTWELLSEDVPPGSNSIIELADGTLVLGATDQGILRSEDGGKAWSQSRSGIDYGAIYTIKSDPNGERVYAGTDHGVFVSTDGARTWTATVLDDTWVIALGVSPVDPNIVLAVNRDGQLYRSTDGGQTWG